MESEDTLTGDFGRSLLTEEERTYQDSITGETWLWRVGYHKFRSGGEDATERLLGADGIVQLLVSDGTRHAVKGLLFQAKNWWRHSSTRILSQCRDLEPWRKAAMLFNYKPGGYEAFDVEAVIAGGGAVEHMVFAYPMDYALGELFLACDRGGLGIYYEPIARELVWPSKRGLVKGTFAVKSQLRIDVAREELPRQIEPMKRPRVVSPNQFKDYPLRRPRRIRGIVKYPEALLFHDKEVPAKQG